MEDIDKKEELEKLPKEVERIAIIKGLILADNKLNNLRFAFNTDLIF